MPRQPHSEKFSNDTVKAGLLVSLHSAGVGGAPLSKEQKRFNSLVRRIKKVRGEMEAARLANETLQSEYLPSLMKAEQEFLQNVRSLVIALHESPWRLKLSKKLCEKLSFIMMDNLLLLLKSTLMSSDEQLAKLFVEYNPEQLSYDEVQEQEEESERNIAASLFNQMFGANLTADDLADEARMREKMSELEGQLKAKEQSRLQAQEQRRSRRKKTAKELATEQQRELAESAVKKTTRQIYLDLVKNFHPDREPDEFLRAEKTRQMQDITAAYEGGDHLRLLELQMTLLSEREHAFAGFEDSYLKHFNQTLQNQLRELEYNLSMSLNSFLDDPIMEMAHPNPRIMRQRVKQRLLDIQENSEDALAQLREVTGSEKSYRQFINECGQMEDESFDIFDPKNEFFGKVPF